MTMHPDTAWDLARQISSTRLAEAASERLVREQPARTGDGPVEHRAPARPSPSQQRSATVRARHTAHPHPR